MRLLRRLSFRTKLLAAFVAVVLFATLIGYLFINQSVQRAFSQFAVGSYSPQERLVFLLVQSLYDRSGDIGVVVEALENSRGDTPVLLVDPDGEVIYSADPRLRGRRLEAAQIEQGERLTLDTGEEWSLVPPRVIRGQDLLADAFLRTTRRSLWLAGLTAGVAAILLAFLVIRQMTGPLKRLDAAARSIAAGRLDERVSVGSSDEIGNLADSFNEMAGSLESAERAKKQMIADVSHELRTPLTAVRTSLEGLRDGLIEPTTEALAGLHDKILLTTRLVQDLHQLALADAGRLSMQPMPTALGDIVESIVETIGVQLEDAGVTLCQEIGELPMVLADAQRIEQVLLNLIANAIRHTPPGGEIRIAAIHVGSDIQISLCDSGPGLSQEALDRVFDRFYRDDPARGSGEGAGLGLSIAKALVEAHGGRIWAENVPSKGACFRFTLPTVASDGIAD